MAGTFITSSWLLRTSVCQRRTKNFVHELGRPRWGELVDLPYDTITHWSKYLCIVGNDRKKSTFSSSVSLWRDCGKVTNGIKRSNFIWTANTWLKYLRATPNRSLKHSYSTSFTPMLFSWLASYWQKGLFNLTSNSNSIRSRSYQPFPPISYWIVMSHTPSHHRGSHESVGIQGPLDGLTPTVNWVC